MHGPCHDMEGISSRAVSIHHDSGWGIKHESEKKVMTRLSLHIPEQFKPHTYFTIIRVDIKF